MDYKFWVLFWYFASFLQVTSFDILHCCWVSPRCFLSTIILPDFHRSNIINYTLNFWVERIKEKINRVSRYAWHKQLLHNLLCSAYFQYASTLLLCTWLVIALCCICMHQYCCFIIITPCYIVLTLYQVWVFQAGPVPELDEAGFLIFIVFTCYGMCNIFLSTLHISFSIDIVDEAGSDHTKWSDLCRTKLRGHQKQQGLMAAVQSTQATP